MAYNGVLPENPLGLPGTIDPAGSLTQTNPLQPPGHQNSATAPLHPHKWGHFPAVVHELDVLLGGTITTAQVWTATLTVTSTASGSGSAAQYVPIVLTATVGGTQTATALGDLFVAAAVAASTVATFADVNSATRLGEIATVTNDAGNLTFLAKSAGIVFEVVFAPESGGTAVEDLIHDGAKRSIRIGIFVARNGTSSDGRTTIIRLLAAGDTSADIFGVVAVGNRVEPIDPASDYEFVSYSDGRDVPIIPLSGDYTALSDADTVHGEDVWVRVVATGSEVAGASSGTPGVLVYTVTPTAVNATHYGGFVQVYDGAGTIVATSPFSYLSDADATDAEIVTGITADLTGSDVDSFLTLSGTATLILTMDAGYSAAFVSTGVGVLAPAVAPANPTHVKLSARFDRTARAGIGAVNHDL